MSGIKNSMMNDNGSFKSDVQLAYEADMSEYHKQFKDDPAYCEWLDTMTKDPKENENASTKK